MYTSHFGLKEIPFSISPDPRYLYLSQRHREALAHLLYGTQQAGGFIQLTGEVGTGKTTLTRALLQQLPKNVDVALLLNPKQSALEFLQSICDELRIPYGDNLQSIKTFVDALNSYLLDAHKIHRHTVLLIDEAQNLSVDVLEQIRLLTNLETNQRKLLQIILVGQPELRILLARKDLRQLAQRITARYHLLPLSERDTRELIQHRLSIAGQNRLFFNPAAIRQIHSISKGIPRLIIILCDRAMLGAYSEGKFIVDPKIVRRAAKEVTGETVVENKSLPGKFYKPAIAASIMIAFATTLFLFWPLSSGKQIKSASNVVIDTTQTALAAETRPETVPHKKITTVAKPQTVTKQQKTVGTQEQQLFVDEEITPPVMQPASLVSTMPATITTPATTPATTTTPDINTVLNSSYLKSDTSSAYAELFALWSRDYYSVKGISACEKADKLGLSCWHNKGTWNNLRVINRPAVIELIDADNNRHSVVIKSMKGQQVSLSFAGEIFAFPITEVDPYWYGSFVVLWRQPPVNLDAIHPGIRGSAALWLKQTLNKVEGVQNSAELDNLFDRDLEKRVKAFQKERYLNDDGVVGKQTMIHLNTALNDPTIPLLLKNMLDDKKQNEKQSLLVIQ